MAKFSRKGKYLTAEMRIRYNHKTGDIEISSADPDLGANGFHLTVPKHTAPGAAAWAALAKHIPQMNEIEPDPLPQIAYLPATLTASGDDWNRIQLGGVIREDSDGNPGTATFHWNTNQYSSLLITGRAGTGKTVAVETVLTHLGQHPTHWDVFMTSDNILNRAKKYRDAILPASMFTYVRSLPGLEYMLTELRAGMSERKKFMRQEKVTHFTELARPPKAVMVIVDALDFLLTPGLGVMEGVTDPYARESMMRKCLEHLGALAREGADAGIHVLLTANQHSNLSVHLRSDMDLRYVLGPVSTVESTLAFGTDAAVRTPKVHGRGMLGSLVNSPVQVQGFFTPPLLTL